MTRYRSGMTFLHHTLKQNSNGSHNVLLHYLGILRSPHIPHKKGYSHLHWQPIAFQHTEQQCQRALLSLVWMLVLHLAPCTSVYLLCIWTCTVSYTHVHCVCLCVCMCEAGCGSARSLMSRRRERRVSFPDPLGHPASTACLLLRSVRVEENTHTQKN